jgi:hypothetical protein
MPACAIDVMSFACGEIDRLDLLHPPATADISVARSRVCDWRAVM